MGFNRTEPAISGFASGMIYVLIRSLLTMASQQSRALRQQSHEALAVHVEQTTRLNVFLLGPILRILRLLVWCVIIAFL